MTVKIWRQLRYTETLTRHDVKHFIYITSFCPHISPSVWSLSPFYRWKHWEVETWIIFSKITAIKRQWKNWNPGFCDVKHCLPIAIRLHLPDSQNVSMPWWKHSIKQFQQFLGGRMWQMCWGRCYWPLSRVQWQLSTLPMGMGRKILYSFSGKTVKNSSQPPTVFPQPHGTRPSEGTL